jgi:hypothetical protein
MEYSIIDYINHTKEYFNTFIEPKKNEEGYIFNPNSGESYKVLQISVHHYIKNLTEYFVQKREDIELEKHFQKAMINQKFYGFDLDSHIRGCMSIAMDLVDHNTKEYYKKIKYIYATLDANAEELLFAILLNKKVNHLENIWLWTAIGELKNIKRVLDGEVKKL